MVDDWKLIPSMLYVYCAPSGAVTVIVPVATAQVGSTTLAVGVGGTAGAAFTVTDAVEVHPPASFTVNVYAFGATLLNIVDAWKLTPSMLYVYCAPSGAVTVIVPVATAQVGSTTLAVGVGGTAGAAFTVTDAVEVHPPASFTVNVYAFGATLLNIVDAWKLTPSMLYVYCAPSGAVTVIVPVATAQVGSTTLAVGVGGTAGAAFTVTDAAEVHPPASFTVNVYAFGATLLNTVDAWKLIPSILYVYCAPSGAVTVIVPVATAQVGSTTLAVGAGGVPGAVFTVIVADEEHPPASCTVNVYVLGVTLLNTVDAWKLIPSIE